MNRTCPKCGMTVTGTACEGCGHVRVPGRLVLTGASTGVPITVHVTTTVGKRLLKSVVGAEARFASEPQFRVVKDPELGWVLAHEAGAVNPTYLNGAKVGVETPALEDGAVITIGRDQTRLSVRLEDV